MPHMCPTKTALTHAAVEKLQPSNKAYDVQDTKVAGLTARVRPSGTITFLLKYRNAAGKNQSYTIGRNGQDNVTASTARATAEELRVEIRKGIDPQAERRKNRAAAQADGKKTLRAYFEARYKPHWLRNRKSAAEAERILISDFGHLFDKPLSEVTQADIELWQSAKEKKGRDRETIKRNRAEIEVFYKRAVRDEWIDVSPLTKLVPIPAKTLAETKPRFLSDAETARLYSTMRERDNTIRQKAENGRKWRQERGYKVGRILGKHYVDHLEPMVIISLKTGLRRNELFSLLWSDIESDFSSLTVRKEIAKSKKPRDIPLARPARDALEKWRDQTTSNRLVFSNDGEKFTTVKTAWRTLMKLAEIEGFRWHDLRHDFASQLVMRDVSIEKVSELMGHADIKTTQRYSHLSNESLVRAIAVLNS